MANSMNCLFKTLGEGEVAPSPPYRPIAFHLFTLGEPGDAAWPAAAADGVRRGAGDAAAGQPAVPLGHAGQVQTRARAGGTHGANTHGQFRSSKINTISWSSYLSR